MGKPFNDISYQDAVQIYLDQSSWITSEHQLHVTSLEKVAEALDRRMSASLQAELTKILRVLDRARPQTNDSTDELADFLAGIDK